MNTPRGFTGHEHLDDFQLVHMNGRVYDPSLGRFMSADPFVQFAESTQGLNRYSYVNNNPLSFTDPSGYFLFGLVGQLFKPIRRFSRWLLSIPIVRTIANIAIGLSCGPAAPGCMALGSAMIAGAAGGDIGDMFKAAAIAYVSAQAFQAVGQEFGNPEFFTADHLGKTIAHGTVGGFIAKASGGSFKHGFLGAAAGQLGAPAIDLLPTADLRVVAAAVVGGTASKLGGGKFANGAVAGAFARLYAEPGGPTDKQGEGGTAFVGGAVDRWGRGPVWGAYQAHIEAGRAGAYFTWDQGAELAGWIEAYGPDVVVIGHSWGGDTAASRVAAGHTVDVLRTVDPVSWIPPDFATVSRQARTWINYNATGGSGSFPNFVAGIGGAWNNAPSAAPGIVHRRVGLDHTTACSVFCRKK